MARPPHITIPPGAAPPAVPSPAIDDFITITPAEPDDFEILDYQESPYFPSSSSTTRSHVPFPVPRLRSISASRPASIHETGSSRISFPEPVIPYSPDRPLLRPSSYSNLSHRSTKSESLAVARPAISRGESRPPSYVSSESSPELPVADLSDDLHNATLQSEEGLRRFQAGELDQSDEEWYRLVPPQAAKEWPKREVQRQCALFEIIKSEKEYVEDMQVVQEVFKDALLNTAPIPKQRLQGFAREVFWNMDEILEHHQRLLDGLFNRQLEQHPFILSIADIILDAILSFRGPYESYIKHYPIAEAYHRKELHRNPKYQAFLSQCGQNPRVQRKDLISFLSRPVTRLPRLMLQLDFVQKHTVEDHDDQKTIPLIRESLNDYMKSSQAGVEASGSKVKFWDLCEGLLYQKGEIIDLDLYDESRTLIHAGPLARRFRADVGYSWADLHVALLDNYLLLLQPRTRPGGTTRHAVISRPIPLEYIRLASFTMPVEYRKEKSHTNGEQSGRFFEFRSSTKYRQLYPFTIYHAYAKSARRYTLYAASDDERETWRKALVDAIAVRKVRQESNMWFAPHTINDGFFKWGGTSLTRPTGKITCAAPLSNDGKNFILVGCQTGIYVTRRGTSDFRRVLKKPNVVSLHALEEFNKVLVHSNEGIEAYALDTLAGVGLGTSRPQDLDASREQVSGSEVAVLFVRVGKTAGRTMVLYATKSFMQLTLHALEVVNSADGSVSSRRSVASSASSFRPFGESVWIPKDTHDITLQHKNIGICTERSIHIVDPTNLGASKTNANVIPTFSETNAPMQALKDRCSNAKPLGLVRVPASDNSTGTPRVNELLVIFDELGCYINRHGVPCRSAGYLRWESKASSVVQRGDHILLLSPEFIEIRTIATGRLIQVIEGQDIRLVHASDRSILVAMRGEDKGIMGTVDQLVELVETAELASQRHDTNLPGLWDEWDM